MQEVGTQYEPYFRALVDRWVPCPEAPTPKDVVVADVEHVVGVPLDPARARSVVGQWIPRVFAESGRPAPASAAGSRSWPIRLRDDPSTVTSSKQQQQQQGRTPQALKDYVARAYDALGQSAEIDRALKSVVDESVAAGDVWTRDWASEPLPDVTTAIARPRPACAGLAGATTAGAKRPIDKVSPSPPGEGADDDDLERMRRRAARFGVQAIAQSRAPAARVGLRTSPAPECDIVSFEVAAPVIGTSRQLEKKYLRLTTEVDASTVRPKEVLCEALKLVLSKWKKNSNYEDACEQLKSIRQDLTVQHIADEFAIRVYECHARLSLQNNDIGEFNQCLTKLHELYKVHKQYRANLQEFLSYKILYSTYIKSPGAIAASLLELKPKQRALPAVKHALEVQKAYFASNYCAYFRLVATCPCESSRFLLDKLTEHMRDTAIRMMMKSYRPTLEVSFVHQQLGFEDRDETEQFLYNYGATIMLVDNVRVIDTKKGLSI
eukprot:m51a1_g4529 hypothetical protein (493) ;mRNA; r:18222-20328